MSEIYVFYGDSNTYGYDPRSMMGDRYPQDVRWTGILQKETGWDSEKTAGSACRLHTRRNREASHPES